MAWERRPAAGCQQAEPVIEPCRDLFGRHGCDSRGGELQRKGDTVQSCADLGHRRCVALVQDELCPRRRCPFGEQSHSSVGPEFSKRRQMFDIGHRQRWHAPGDLAGDPQTFATSRQHADLRAPAQDGIHEPRAGIQDVLAVVEHQQHPPCSQSADEGTDR